MHDDDPGQPPLDDETARAALIIALDRALGEVVALTVRAQLTGALNGGQAAYLSLGAQVLQRRLWQFAA